MELRGIIELALRSVVVSARPFQLRARKVPGNAAPGSGSTRVVTAVTDKTESLTVH